MLRLFAAALVLLAAPLALAQPGTLDPSFATGGTYSFDAQQSGATQLLVRPDGRVLIIGQIENAVAVISLLADGTPDPSFGTNGVGRFADGQDIVVLGAALVSDGGLVLSGARIDGDDVATAAALLKLDASGTPEAAFGTGGIATFEGSAGTSAFVAVRERAGGGLASGGTYVSDDGTEAGVATARFTASGALDDTFGTDGVVRAPSASGLAAFSGGYGPEGELYVLGGVSAGFFETDAAVARVLGDGSLDAAFGSDGVAVLEAGLPFALALGVAVDGEGRIVGTGQGVDFGTRASEAFVFRLLPDGTLDRDFAGGGLFRTTAGAPIAQGTALAIQDDGAIVFGGVAGTEARPDPFVGRLDASGAPDASFGTGGFATVSFGGPALGSELALQPDGRIVLVGQRGDGNADPAGIVAARLLGGGTISSCDCSVEEPGPLALRLAGPNPFGRTTALALEAAQSLAARVAAYDALGREVAVLHSGPLAPGRTLLDFDASGLAPGAYLVRASAGGASVTLGVVKR